MKANSRDTKALIFKGRAIAGRAEKLSGDQKRAAFQQARTLFIAANKLDTEDPEPLVEFYQSYVAERVRPTANAVDGLHYASELAPQDDGLRLNSALRYLEEGKPLEAKQALASSYLRSARRRHRSACPHDDRENEFRKCQGCFGRRRHAVGYEFGSALRRRRTHHGCINLPCLHREPEDRRPAAVPMMMLIKEASRPKPPPVSSAGP